MRYVLMHREHRVLEFDVDFATGDVRIVRPLERFDLAPFGMWERNPQSERILRLFVGGCRISSQRVDKDELLSATGTQSLLELAFAAGGFSMYDQYWYADKRHADKTSTRTWEEGNFLANGWDHSFGEAVMRRDYDALRGASLATPDLTCGGASRKAWVRDAHGPLLLKADDSALQTNAVGEMLTSRMLARLLPEGEFVAYELASYEGAVCSACRPLVTAREDLVTAWQVILSADGPVDGVHTAKDVRGHRLLEHIRLAFERLGLDGGERLVAKTAVIEHLVFNIDIHPRNLGFVRRADVGALRPAPFFDYDRAFGLFDQRRMEWAGAHPDLAALFIAQGFSNLDASWDYSWYDPHALDGFEDEIERTLGACDSLPRGYAQCAAQLFSVQHAYVNSVASGARMASA